MVQGLVVLGSVVLFAALGLICYRANPASITNYALTVVSLVLAWFAYSADPKRPANRAFALFLILVASWGADLTFLFLAPTEDMARNGLRFIRIGLLFLVPGMIRFLMVFTQQERPRWPLEILFGTSALLAFVSMSGYMERGVAHNGINWYPIPNAWYHLYSAEVFLGCGYAAFLAGRALRHESQRRLRLQYGQIFAGLLILCAAGWTNQVATYVHAFVPNLGWGTFAKHSFQGALGGLFFFVLIAFAIVRHRWLDLSFVIRRTLLYSTLTAAIAGLYAGLLVALGTLIQTREETSFVASLATILISSFVLLPLRDQLQRGIDRLLHRQPIDDRDMIQRLSEALDRTIGYRESAQAFLRILIPTLGLRGAKILLFGHMYDAESETISPLSVICRDPIDRNEPPETAPPEVVTFLREQNLELAFPIVAHDRAVGLLCVGPKASEFPFGRDEWRSLLTAARQLGLAAERSRLYEEVLSVKSYVENVVRSIDDGVLTVNTTGIVTSANPAAVKFLGDEPMGKPVSSVLSEAPELVERVDRALAGQGSAHQEIFVRERTLLAACTPLQDSKQNRIGGLISFADVTALKEMERRLQQDRRLAAIGELASQIAHEIRNPIGSMKFLVESLPERRTDPRFEKIFMETMPAEIERLNRLVNDLLLYARPGLPTRVPTDLVQVLESSLRLSQAELGGVSVQREFSAERPIVQADGEQLKQVFLNLIRNAAQAMQTSPVKELRLRLSRNGGTQIDIADTGAGMAPEHLRRIFTPFFSTKSGGTGLGLAIVHRIIDQHGWSIEVQSRPEAGTTFRIHVPV